MLFVLKLLLYREKARIVNDVELFALFRCCHKKVGMCFLLRIQVDAVAACMRMQERLTYFVAPVRYYSLRRVLCDVLRHTCAIILLASCATCSATINSVFLL